MTMKLALGNAIPTLEGVIAGIKNGDDISAIYTTVATSSSNVGSYAIEASLVDLGSRLSNYTVTNTDGTLTVVKADQTISFDQVNSIDIASTNTASLMAVASSGLGVTFALTEGDGSISGSVLTVNSSGNFTITATQGGNGNYNAAPSLTKFSGDR